MPHVGREEYQPAGHRLNKPARQAMPTEINVRFAELYSPSMSLRIGYFRRHPDIIGGTDPPQRVDVHGVVAAALQTHRPGRGKIEALTPA